jgi:hypothetical protein
MVDIATISSNDLEKDLRESELDISACELALANGVGRYSGGLVQKRLDANKHFVTVITSELNRRAEIVEAGQNGLQQTLPAAGEAPLADGTLQGNVG